jgi:hypothetical protein
MNMNLSELINEILSEWAYRCDNGTPNPKNPIHLKELGIVFSEMGLSHIKNDLVENLLMEKGKTPEKNVVEADGNFTNPALNKSIKYKNDKGEDAEGIVGNLLRLPKEHPGRVAAEKTLPADGTPERDALNKDLGGQNQPGGAEKPKDAKGGEEAPKEDPTKAAQAMFDPKADPAMAARMNKEKEVQAQLAKDAEAQNEPPPTPKNQTTNKQLAKAAGFDNVGSWYNDLNKKAMSDDPEVASKAEKDLDTYEKNKVKDAQSTDDFNPIDSKDVAKEMPQADPETFAGGSDIPDGVTPEELNKFNTDISKVAQQVADAKAKGEPAPNINLCDVTVPGTNLYCDDNLGIPRDEMPQFKGTAQPGSRAAGMDVDASGEVDTEPVFKEMLKEKGIKTLQTQIPADKLKATQKDLVGAKVVGMMGALEKDPNHPKITAPIYVSRDGHVIDGHHRWAAIVAHNAANPDNQIPMKTTVLDMDIKDAIPMANKFAEDMGIAAKKADANKEEPQKVTSAPKVTEKIKKKIENWTEKEKAFFDRNEGAPGSKERRSLGQALKDKAAGAWKAIKKGAKHEVEEFKAAGSGVKNFFSGKELSKHEQKALKAVAFKVVTTAVFGAAFGGLSHGVAAFGKHVAMEFIPHIIGETILKGVGKAAVFADADGEAETDANMIKFTELIAKGLEEMEITPEMMEQMVDSYNEKKENGEVDSETTTGVKAEHLHLVDELMLEMIYGFIEEAKGKKPTPTTGDWKLAARAGGPDGKVVYFQSPESKKDALAARTHVDVDKKLQAKAEQPKSEPIPGADLFGQDYKDARGGSGTKGTKKVNYDSRVDGEASSKVEQTFNTDSKFSEPGMKHEERVKRLEAMKAKKINKVTVDDVYTAMGVDRGTTKFPAKYMSVLTNALNFAKGKFTITDLTDAAGAGTLDSTLGELVTLMGATLQDPAQRKQFFDWARQQVKEGGNESALTIAWINSAQDSCEAFHRKLKKDCPGGHEVNTNFWDIPSEAKAAGVKNYKRDKGKSTDINTMVDCIAKDGTRTQKWLQPSLKKNKKVNGFNSTTGRVFATTVLRWASPEVKAQYSAFGDELDSYEGLDDNAPAGEYTITDKKGNVRPMTIKERKTQLNKLMQNIEKDFEDKIPSEANPKLARERQDTLHKKMENDEKVVAERNEFLTKYLAMTPAERKKVCVQISKDLNQKGDKYAMELMETLDALAKYDLTTAENFDSALEEMGIKNPKDRRKLNSALMNGVVNTAGNKTQSAKFKEKITKNSHDHSKAVLEYLISDNENKKALLENISTQFPLKDLMEGKEWAILGEKGGGINLDRDTITKCLGADKFEDVVEKLIIVDYNGEPTLAYAADNGKRTIPIGVLNCRPDGIMYGSTWKLELSIHEGFADCCKTHDK